MVTESSPEKNSVHGALAEAALGAVIIERSPEVRSTWTPALEAGRVIHQHIEEAARQNVSRIVFAIDGSAGMKEWKSELAEAIEHLPPETEVDAIIADDEPMQLDATPKPGGKKNLEALSRRIRGTHFVGGRDNVPALEQAWDLASATTNGAVIWIHDDQPVLLSSPDSLRQRLERGIKRVPIYDLQLRSGPNRLTEKLDGLSSLKLVPHFAGSIRSNLDNFVAGLNGKARTFEIIRERAPENSITPEVKKVSRHIERLWASDEALRLADARQRDEAVKLAASQQLVTPLTGAVVLENKQQYAENNLKPSDVNTVPTIPEPQTLTLLLFGSGWLFWRRSHRRRTG